MSTATDSLDVSITVSHGSGCRYVDMQGLANSENNFKVTQALSVLLCFLILFKFLGRHPRLGILVATLGQASSDLLGFFAMGMVVYAAFGFAGTTLFGETSQHWAHMGHSFNTLFMIIMGEYGMSDLKEMSASTWHINFFYYGYVAVVYCVLFNMLLAIVMDSYAKVQKMSGDTTVKVSFEGEVVLRSKCAHMRARAFTQQAGTHRRADSRTDGWTVGRTDGQSVRQSFRQLVGQSVVLSVACLLACLVGQTVA